MAASNYLIRLSVVLLCTLQYMCPTPSSATSSKHHPRMFPGAWGGWNASEPSLEYYVQVIVGEPYTGVLVKALDSNVTNSFGETDAFQFNITEGTSNTSKAYGFVYGFTVDVSYTTVTHEVEVETVSYDNGAGLNGTFNLQGLISTAPSVDLAITGGTGSFLGVRGHAVISMINANLYHHAVYFL